MNAYRTPDDDEDDRDEDDRDEDDRDDECEDGNDSENGDEEPTLPCPSCQREIFEDSPRCPYCGRFISAEDHGGDQKPIWVVATALVCLAIAVWWVLVAF